MPRWYFVWLFLKFNLRLKLYCVISAVVLIATFRAFQADAAERPASNSTKVTAPTNQMALDAVVTNVLEHNPELSFYNAEIAAARGGARTAAAWVNPEISATVGDKRVTGGGLATEGVAWSVSVRQPFEWPGRIPLRKAIANQQIQLAELGFAQFKAALAARTRSVVYGLFAAQQKAAAAREVADRFHALRHVLVQRDLAGITPELELRIIEATEITMLRKASEASVAEQAAMLELNQLRGQPWQHAMRIAPLDVAFSGAPNTEHLLAAAQTSNFEIRMRQVELEQQGFRVSLARNERYPTVTVGPYVSQERASDRERQIGIGISIPLSLWNQNEGNIETAAARQKQAETAMYVTQRSIERQVVEKALMYQAKLTEMAKWRPESVAAFRKAAQLADRHYRLGAVPITTYVELQKQYLDAVEALLETRREALEAGQQLGLLTGLNINAVQTKSPKP
ncbi:MAG: TolC family protein [Deltaproteobacteria bacterium]|nr:TolC family protein [Deltaproteobacteria bacterium]